VCGRGTHEVISITVDKIDPASLSFLDLDESFGGNHFDGGDVLLTRRFQQCRLLFEEERMKHSRIIIVVFLLLSLFVIASCAGARQPAYEEAVNMEPAPAAMAEKAVLSNADVEISMQGNAGPALEQIQNMRKIIYNADMYLVVKDTEAAAQQIEAMAQNMGGYVARMNGYRQDDSIVYDITIRIPANKFDAGRSALRSMAVRVDHENISTNDVTDQYYDIDARLRTLKATEEELTELLRETRKRGGKVEDIMEIYDRLVQIRSEIESLQGQLNRLDKLVSFSTIDIHLEPSVLSKPIEGEGWRPAEVIRKSLGTLVDVLASLGTLLIEFVIIVLPVLILILLPVLLLVWLIRIWQKRRSRANKQEEEAKA
jgi:hypothetical protein